MLCIGKEVLIQELIRTGYLKTPRIIEAFRAVDRMDFVIPEYEREAYGNYPLPIGFGQTISQPLTVAFMLELSDPRPGEKILDIGAGSGWQAALLARIVTSDKQHATRGGTVLAIERIPELAEMAERNIRKYPYIEKKTVRILCTDGSWGAPAKYVPAGGFDKIVAAAAASDIPTAWKEQLKTGGRIVAPVGESIIVLNKQRNGALEREEHYGFAFVPLVGDTREA